MPRPTKLTYEIQRRIGKNIALGLPYALAAEAAGITYRRSMNGCLKIRQRNWENIFSFHNILTNTMRCG
jgi:hypothetical protein